MLGAVLAETGVVDRASSMGETAAGLTLSGAVVGLVSGVSAGDDEEAEAEAGVAGLLETTVFAALPWAASLLLLLLSLLEVLP